MIVELGSSATEIIRVTAEFSNAVLVAVMPYVSNVAKRLDLPVPQPLTMEHVAHCSIVPLRNWGVEIGVDSGWVFAFRNGYVNTIQGPKDFFGLQSPDRIPEFFGDLRMSKQEAVELARNSIRKLGIPIEDVFAEQEPRVVGPIPNGTNIVPHFRIQWMDPRSTGQAPGTVTIDVDGSARLVERIRIRSRSLERPLPHLEVTPPRDPSSPVWPRINPEYARQLVPFVLKAVEDYAEKLDLPVPRPLTTNQVARFKVAEDMSSPRVELDLTNRWRFVYSGVMVNGFYASDDLFSTRSEQYPLRIKDLIGKWSMSEEQAKDLVRREISRLGYPSNLVHLDFAPQVQKPAVPGVPRFMFRWYYHAPGQDIVSSSIEAEVDADKQRIKSLCYYDMSLARRGPKIDAPLLLQPVPTPTTSQSGAPLRPSMPPRPIEKAAPSHGLRFWSHEGTYEQVSGPTFSHRSSAP